MATSILGGAIHHAATRIQRVWRLVSWRRAFVAFSEQAKVSMESANGFMGEEHHLTDNDGMNWIFWTNLIFVAPDWYDFSTLVRHMSYDIWLTNIVLYIHSGWCIKTQSIGPYCTMADYYETPKPALIEVKHFFKF